MSSLNLVRKRKRRSKEVFDAGCIDPEGRFPQYVSAWEDPVFVGSQDPWHKVLLCRSGHIAPSGDDYLLACTDSGGNHATKSFRSGAVPGEVIQDAGPDGINFEFHIDHFDAVAEVMKIRRRRLGNVNAFSDTRFSKV